VLPPELFLSIWLYKKIIKDGITNYWNNKWSKAEIKNLIKNK